MYQNLSVTHAQHLVRVLHACTRACIRVCVRACRCTNHIKKQLTMYYKISIQPVFVYCTKLKLMTPHVCCWWENKRSFFLSPFLSFFLSFYLNSYRTLVFHILTAHFFSTSNKWRSAEIYNVRLLWFKIYHNFENNFRLLRVCTQT